MESRLMNAWSAGSDANEPAGTPLQDETFRHDMNRWGTRRCDLGMGSTNVAESYGCGLILEDNAPRPFTNWNMPANSVQKEELPCGQSGANDFSNRAASMRPARNDFPQMDDISDAKSRHHVPAERYDMHEAIHNVPVENFPNPSTHSPEPFRPGHHSRGADRDIAIAHEKHHARHEHDAFPSPSANVSDHLYRKPVAKPVELTIPTDSEYQPGEVDSNFFRGDRFSNYVGKDRCSVTTGGDKHWDVLKTPEGKTSYARIQEPLPDGSGYRITEYRSPFRDSQLLGSCFEVDNEGRVKQSSLETLQLDASLRLARKNMTATVDLNGNLTVSVPGAGRIEDMSRTYYRNGTEMDNFVDNTRVAQDVTVSAKYRTDEHGQRQTRIVRGQSEPTEVPYMVVTRSASDNAVQPANEKSVYMYDSFENNYYCTQGPDTGNRFDISVRNRILIRNQRPVVSNCRH